MIVVTSPKEPEFVRDSCGSFVKSQQKFWLSPPTPKYVDYEAIPEIIEDWTIEDEIEYENSLTSEEEIEDDEIDYQIWKAEQWTDF